MKIIWLSFAKRVLSEIYEYHAEVAGKRVARNLIKNIVGIDPANDAADHKEQIEFFDTEQRFDIAFCLGSLNFGDFTTIGFKLCFIFYPCRTFFGNRALS